MNKYHSTFVSDVHIGTPQCKASELLEFLQENTTDNLYLIGDMIDTWNLGRRWYFDEPQAKLLDYLVGQPKVYLFSGNHDESNIALTSDLFYPLVVHEAMIYRTIKDKKLLIAHGHQFENSLFRVSSDYQFSIAMLINNWFHSPNGAKRLLGRMAMGLSASRESKLRANIERSFQGSDYDGVICGHLHKPTIDIGSKILYFNTGDWVRHCSALIETHEGLMYLKTSYDT